MCPYQAEKTLHCWHLRDANLANVKPAICRLRSPERNKMPVLSTSSRPGKRTCLSKAALNTTWRETKILLTLNHDGCLDDALSVLGLQPRRDDFNDGAGFKLAGARAFQFVVPA